MAFPKRLLASRVDPYELALLRSIESDQPSQAALARTARSLGLQLGAASAGLSAGAAAASAASTSAKAGAGVLAAQANGLLVAKYAAIGLAAGLLATGGGYGASSLLGASNQPATSPPQTAKPAAALRAWRGAAASDAVVQSESAAPSTSTRASVVLLADRNRRSPSGPMLKFPQPAVSGTGVAGFAELPVRGASSLPPRAGALAGEVSALDRARKALAQQQSREALAELDELQRTHSNPVLATEATVLRIEALLQQGEREAARRMAAELLVHQPPSRLADRLRAVVNGSTIP